MKQIATIGLLICLNLGLFFYFQANDSKPKVTLIDNQPVQPEKIKLLSAKQIAQLPPQNPEAIPPLAEPTPTLPTVCYVWGNLAASRVNLARTALLKRAPEASISEQDQQKITFYWVYIPQQASLTAARSKIEELKILGVKESFIMQEADYKNAISLGVFHEEAAADKFLEALKTKGVISATKGTRYKENNQVNLLIQNLKSEEIIEIEKLGQKFPNSELKPVACQ